jgi:hypothetical protein
MQQPNDVHGVRRLELRVEPYDPVTVDQFELIILVDGENLLAAQRFVGFDPWDILGPDVPLLPPQPIPRVAVARCGCGIAGCGALAPLILKRGDEVVWTDFRSFTGDYDGPIAEDDPDLTRATVCDLPEVVFDGTQYRAEVARASADYSWETPQRRTTRLFVEYLDRETDRLSELGWRLRPRRGQWSRPGWLEDRLHVVLQDVTDLAGPLWPKEICVLLRAEAETPAESAALMVDFLFRTPPEQWPQYVEGGDA